MTLKMDAVSSSETIIFDRIQYVTFYYLSCYDELGIINWLSHGIVQRGIEENHDKYESAYTIFQSRFQPGTSRREDRNITA
jgi:hypothetical protein